MADASAYAAAVTFLGALALHCEPGEHRISVAIDGSAAQIRQILIDLDRPGMTVDTLSLHGTSLEDVFLSLTGHRSISGTAARGATVPADRDMEIVHV